MTQPFSLKTVGGMSRSRSSVSRAYPLAGRSRSRRRLALDHTEGAITSETEALVEPEPPIEEQLQEHVVPFRNIHAAEGFQEIKRMLDGYQPITWVFTGDSVTHGGCYTAGHRSYTELFSERIRWELRRYLDVVINTGVAGEKSDGLLRNLEWRALRFNPDITSIMIGLNDASQGAGGAAAFASNLRQTIDRLGEGGGLVVLHTPHRISRKRHMELQGIGEYVKVIRNIANDLKIPCIDHWAHWEQMCQTRNQLKKWLSSDALHPGVEGHREIARLTFHEMGIFDSRSPTCH